MSIACNLGCPAGPAYTGLLPPFADINDRLWAVPAKRDASTSGSDAVGGSNYGSTFVDVAAPGVSLLTTRLRTAAEAKKAGTRPVSLVRVGGWL